MSRFADRDDPLTEDEWPDESDVTDDDASVDLERCGGCGRMIAEDSPRCPHCGEWGPLQGGAAAAGWKRAIWTLAVIGLIAVILAVWLGLRL